MSLLFINRREEAHLRSHGHSVVSFTAHNLMILVLSFLRYRCSLDGSSMYQRQEISSQILLL